jgi:PAS domain S-box-containing protein
MAGGTGCTMNFAMSDWRSAIGMLERDAALAPYLRNAAVFVWSLDGKDILAADARADELRGRLGAHFGERARERMRLMGQGLAPLTGVRLERLSLSPNPSHPPFTCACRRIRLGTGQEGLLVIAQLVGFAAEPALAPAAAAPARQATTPPPAAAQPAQPVPPAQPAPQAQSMPRPPVAAALAQPVEPAPPSAGLNGPAPDAIPLRSADPAPAPETPAASASPVPAAIASSQAQPAASLQATPAGPASAPASMATGSPPLMPAIPRRLRFVWSSDAEGRVTGLTPEFLALLRLTREDELLGRSWAELTGSRLRDNEGALAAGLASRATFSDAPVLFRIGRSNGAINTALSGSPVFDAEGNFQGFRGFGVLRPAPAAPAAPPRPPAPAGATPAASPAPASTPQVQPTSADVAPVVSAASQPEPAATSAMVAPEAAPTPQAEAGLRSEPAAPPATPASPTAPAARGLAAMFPAAPIRARRRREPRETMETPPAPPPLAAQAAADMPAMDPQEAAPPAIIAPPMIAAPGATEAAQTPDRAEATPEQSGGDAAPAAEDEPIEALAAGPKADDQAPPDGATDAGAAAPREAIAPPAPGPAAPASRDAASAGEPLKPAPAGNDDEPPRLPAVAALQTRLPELLRNTPGQPLTPPDAPAMALRPVLAPAKADLSPAERQAFRQIAEALGADMDERAGAPEAPAAPGASPPAAPRTAAPGDAAPGDSARAPQGPDVHAELLDKLPIGVLVSRNGEVAYANRTFLDLLGYADLADISAHGGMESLFRGRAPDEGGGAVLLVTKDGELETVEARLSAIAWQGRPATLMSFRRALEADAPARARALELDLDATRKRMAELSAILDTATDGVVTLDERGRILSLNSAAEALFGYDQREVTGELATMLFAPESHAPAMDYLDGLKGGGVASVLNDGREVVGMVRQGGRVPLFMTMGRIAEGQDTKFCAVLRDITAWKKAENELTDARKAAEQASAQKSDVLAKISHEIRTPLNAIIGFSEVMAEERFGPLGSDRYKEYARDIRESGSYLISLVNDLLDLAKIEAGRLDLDFESVNLNEIANAAVSLLQPEAARNRVVLRTGLSTRLPPVVADERSLRQIVINLLSNAVKFTDAGGQVIVSTALGDKGEAILRVRDTGIGMTPDQLKLALEPFRQVSATRRGGGTGLGLPLTKALVEANRGAFQISSVPKEGTLAEVVFPPQRVLAG